MRLCIDAVDARSAWELLRTMVTNPAEWKIEWSEGDERGVGKKYRYWFTCE